MATVTQAQNGRRVTLANVSGQTVGACGTIIPPGKVVSVKLAKIQGNAKYMTELHELVHNDKLQVMVNGSQLPAHYVTHTEIKNLDAALEAKVALVLDLWTDPATADVDGYKAAFTAPATATTYSGSDFDGAIGQGSVDFARNVTITGVTGLGEALVEKSAVIIGYDIEGQLRSETLTISTGGQGASDNTTYSGTVAFKSLYSVYIPADGSGSPGDYSIGFGNVLGLTKPLTQGGIIQEFVNNAGPGVAGTWAVSSSSGPNGTYTPNSAPNGARDYLIIYYPN